MQSTSDAIQAPTRGWRRLPAEMRVEIYKHMWTPTTIVISTKWPCPQKLPVTLHLNRESRGETLRSYYPYTVHFSADPFWNRLSKFGYINPHLDIVHFDSLPGRRGSGPLEVEFPGITKPLLRITIDQGNSAFDPRILDPVLPIIRSIDFWSFPEGGFPDFPDDLRRYRICRIPASTPRTPVARFEDALFVPEYPLRADQNQVSCTKPDCRSPFTYFKWRNVPSENQVITSLPPDLDHLVLDGRLTSELTPVNKYKASELRLPCAVSYWSNDKTMDALQRDKVILFDIGNGAQHTGIQQQGDEWVVLKVVSPTQVPSEEVIMGSLAYHRKVLMRGYFPEVPHWPVLAIGIDIPADEFDDVAFRIFRLKSRHHLPGEIVHGVCDPSFMFEDQNYEASARLPLVSDHFYCRMGLGERWLPLTFWPEKSMAVEEGEDCSISFLASEHHRAATRLRHCCDT